MRLTIQTKQYNLNKLQADADQLESQLAEIKPRIKIQH